MSMMNNMVNKSCQRCSLSLRGEMVERAKANLKQVKLPNVSLYQASAEQLDFPPEGFDVAISNGVLNLVVNKERALAEIYKVLKPSGQLMLADQVLTGEPLESKKDMLASRYR
jgi:ubiquinone/menaquinone biosynthesis C-methylase UbiE